MSVVRTEDKYLCDACGEEYIGPPNTYENHQKTDMKQTVCIAVFDHDYNRAIGRRLYLCPACSDAVLEFVEKMEPKEVQVGRIKWWTAKGAKK